MAVYTNVSDAALAAYLEEYDIGSPRAFKGIAEGVENSNYYLETDKGRFILTLFETRRPCRPAIFHRREASSRRKGLPLPSAC